MTSLTRESIDLYVQSGIPPGGFLMAVLTNDLKEAALRADSTNRYALFDIVKYLWDFAPAECWGGIEEVQAWLLKKHKERSVA